MTKKDSNDLQLYNQAIRFFAYGQLGFFLSLIICVLLLPQGLLANHGFSYYGDYTLTTIPYRVAFVITGVFTLLSSWFLPAAMPCKVIKIAFRLMIPLLLGIAITTAPHSPLLDNIHRPIGVILFVLQLALDIWLARNVIKDRLNQVLLALLLGSGLVSVLALSNIIRYLIEGQIIFQLAFGLLIIHTLTKLRS